MTTPPAPRAAPRDGPAGEGSVAEPEWTVRALATGFAAGALLALANLSMGLRTGWWDSGHVTASIVSFALASALARRRGRFGPLENNVAQSAATAMAASPAAMNLLGAIPALALLGIDPAGWAVVGLGLALAALGVLGAAALRRRLLDEERLPFPTGVATAEVIRALHEGRGPRRPARALAATGLAAAAVAAARDVLGWIPAVSWLPAHLGAVPAPALTLGIAWSPMLLGAGVVAGLRNGLSVALGAAIAWGAVAPRLVAAGVAEPGFGTLVTWLAWPGAGLVLGAAAVSLGAQWRAFLPVVRDLVRAGAGAGGRERRAAIALAAVAAAAAVGFASAAFGLRPATAAAGLVLGLVLSVVCARAVGQTDILPAGEVAQVAQVALGGGSAAGAVGAGALAAGPSAQMGAALWSLRAGQALGGTPRVQVRAMLAGALAGAAVALPAYAVLVRAYGIGSAALPAPGAVPWRAIAEVMGRGGAAVPAGALAAAAIGLAAGAALELAGRRVRALPSPGAVGMGFIAPAYYAAAICAGGVLGALWRRLRPATADELGPAAAGGAIAGESLAGVVVAALVAAGVLRAP